jgi:hypothetical protein
MKQELYQQFLYCLQPMYLDADIGLLLADYDDEMILLFESEEHANNFCS